MAHFGNTPAYISLRAAMKVVDAIGGTSGTADASNPERIVVSFSMNGLGDPSYIAQSTNRAFQDAGFDPLFMNVTDSTATFHLRDRAAA